MITRTALGISIVLVAVASSPALAQQSASYKLTESAVNAGGRPVNGAGASSTSYRVSFDAIGDAVAGGSPSSASYRLGSGFVSWFPPPGEAKGLRFSDRTTLRWDPEPSVGTYNLYRDFVSALAGGGTGTCFVNGVSTEQASDGGSPGAGKGFFYLVTAENRLAEEGTKGKRSSGSERPNPAPCP
ncbi:MAG: hypothetical protein MUF27_14130 [Acidobacteria bacterium]|nr:hypothetical protein [Acidobacteriota bacterium]